MKRVFSFVLVITICVLSTFALFGCQPSEVPTCDNKPIRTVVELDENNYWKYIDIEFTGNAVSSGNEGSISCRINGVLDFALYEDVMFAFDVIYHTPGQAEEEYQSYTMYIACNAAGDAAFETTYLGITNVTIGKWLGADGELVSFENYNFKIHLESVSGKVIYTA